MTKPSTLPQPKATKITALFRLSLWNGLALSMVAHAALIALLPLYSNRITIGQRGSGPLVVDLWSSAPQRRLEHQHRRLAKLETTPLVDPALTESAEEALPAPSQSDAGGSSEAYSEAEVDAPVQLLHPPRLRYPKAAYHQGRESDVVLFLLVDPNGRVRDAKVTRSGGLEFDEAALEASSQLKFTPATKSGSPVAVHVHWTCRFRIAD